MQLIQRLWHDQRGAVLSIELVLIGSIVLLGLIVGLAAYRDSVVQELGDTGASIGSVNQSYSVSIQNNGFFVNPKVTTKITESAGTVTFRREFQVDTDGDGMTDADGVIIETTHENYGYEDNPDLCDAIPPAPQDPSGQAPAGIMFTDASGFDEGSSP